MVCELTFKVQVLFVYFLKGLRLRIHGVKCEV